MMLRLSSMTQTCPSVSGPAVVIVGPSWHSCGSYEVFRAQIKTFEQLGYAVYFLAVPSVTGPTRKDKKYWNHYYEMTTHIGARHRGHTARDSMAYLKPGVLSAVWAAYRGSFVNYQTLPARLAPIPRSLREFASRHSVELVLCNHYFNMPLAERICDAAARGTRPKLLLETHDVQTIHYVREGKFHPLTRAAQCKETMLADELAIASRADALIHLNEDELKFFESNLPDHKHGLIYPPMPRRWDPREAAINTEADSTNRFDFLIVASSNYGNYRNLCWFFDKVWSQAYNSCFNLKIVGNVDHEFISRKDPRYGMYRHCFVGRVEKLEWFYHNCRAVLLPVIEGQGVAIKTIEALSYGKPVVATPLAFRGFLRSLGPQKLSGYSIDAHSFRRAMSDIGDGIHPAVNWEAIKYYEALFSEDVYLARYRDFLDRIQVHAPAPQAFGPSSEIPRSALEYVT